jgi:hypothetical protein
MEPPLPAQTVEAPAGAVRQESAGGFLCASTKFLKVSMSEVRDNGFNPHAFQAAAWHNQGSFLLILVNFLPWKSTVGMKMGFLVKPPRMTRPWSQVTVLNATADCRFAKRLIAGGRDCCFLDLARLLFAMTSLERWSRNPQQAQPMTLIALTAC